MSSRTPEKWVRRKTGPPSAEESRKGLPDDRNRAEQESALSEADAPAGKIVGRRTSPRPISDKSNASESQNRQARDRRSGPGARPGKFPDAIELDNMRCPDEQTSQPQSPTPHHISPHTRPTKTPHAPQ